MFCFLEFYSCYHSAIFKYVFCYIRLIQGWQLFFNFGGILTLWDFFEIFTKGFTEEFFFLQPIFSKDMESSKPGWRPNQVVKSRHPWRESDVEKNASFAFFDQKIGYGLIEGKIIKFMLP